MTAPKSTPSPTQKSAKARPARWTVTVPEPDVVKRVDPRDAARRAGFRL